MGLRAVRDPHAFLSRPEPSCLLSPHVTAQEDVCEVTEPRNHQNTHRSGSVFKVNVIQLDIIYYFFALLSPAWRSRRVYDGQ